MCSNKPFILLKISRKEYIKEIIEEGYFHFTLASFFRENAIIFPESLIYDIDECSYSRRQTVYKPFFLVLRPLLIHAPRVGNSPILGLRCNWDA